MKAEFINKRFVFSKYKISRIDDARKSFEGGKRDAESLVRRLVAKIISLVVDRMNLKVLHRDEPKRRNIGRRQMDFTREAITF